MYIHMYTKGEKHKTQFITKMFYLKGLADHITATLQCKYVSQETEDNTSLLHHYETAVCNKQTIHFSTKPTKFIHFTGDSIHFTKTYHPLNK